MSTAPPLAYAPEVRSRFPQLASATLQAEVDTRALGGLDLDRWLRPARERLAEHSEAELEPIRAWRRAFAEMGLRPTQYRCASEAVLRRLRTTGDLPRIHPLVDLCNAVSAATALPIAAIDLDQVDGALVVRPATGTERYLAFSGEVEHPDPGEIVFADEAGAAHARRWTHRQSAQSAVSPTTRRVLVVCEAHHETAAADVRAAIDEVRSAFADAAAMAGQPTE